MRLKVSLFFSFLTVIVLNSAAVSYNYFAHSQISLIVNIAALVLSIIIAIYISTKISQQVSMINKKIHLLAEESSEIPKIKVTFKELVDISYFIDNLQNKTQEMKKGLSTILEHVDVQGTRLKAYTDNLETGSNRISSTMQEISSGADEQANAASSLTESMQHFTNTIMTVVMNGENIRDESKSMLTITGQGSQLMSQSIEKMDIIDETIKLSLTKVKGLDEMTLKITQLVTVIQEIAEQTNLLALNAAIEAARAGEQGRGFAVVADEVRKLAEQVSHSISDITTTANGIQAESKMAVETLEKGYEAVSEGTSQIKTTGDTFGELDSIITSIGKEIEGVSNSLYEVLDNTKVINDSITNIASVSEEAAAGIEEAAASSQQLTSSVNDIRREQDNLEKEIKQLKI